MRFQASVDSFVIETNYRRENGMRVNNSNLNPTLEI